MNKPYTILAFIFMIGLSLMPPIDFFISNPVNTDYWLWMVIIAGFFGVLTLFIKTDYFIPLITIGGFINCFFSSIPYLSFTAYVSLVACCYFFIVCQRVEDWNLLFKAAQSVLILNAIIIIMQFFRHDRLMNFSLNGVQHYGTVGHYMQMASFSVVLSSFLLSFNMANIFFAYLVSLFCHSSWSFFSVSCGVFCYLYHTKRDYKYFTKISLFIFMTLLIFGFWVITSGKIPENLSKDSGRFFVWVRSIILSLQHPFSGWGIGSYKDLFLYIGGLPGRTLPWRGAHNFIIQLIFEIGYFYTAIILFGIAELARQLKRHKKYILLSGLVMIFVDGQVHFPDRMIQAVPIIILFLAYCQKEISYGRDRI